MDNGCRRLLLHILFVNEFCVFFRHTSWVEFLAGCIGFSVTKKAKFAFYGNPSLTKKIVIAFQYVNPTMWASFPGFKDLFR